MRSGLSLIRKRYTISKTTKPIIFYPRHTTFYMFNTMFIMSVALEHASNVLLELCVHDTSTFDNIPDSYLC